MEIQPLYQEAGHALAFKSQLRRKGIRVVSITEQAEDNATGRLLRGCGVLSVVRPGLILVERPPHERLPQVHRQPSRFDASATVL